MNPKINLALYTSFLFIIFLLAYLGYVPTELFFFPFFDSLGHFVLYGLWGYFFAIALNKTVFAIAKMKVQKGILIVIPIAVVEESVQSLSAARTFSFFDMGWGILGISTACLLLNYKMKKLQGRPPARKRESSN